MESTLIKMEAALQKLEDEVESVKIDICKDICKWPDRVSDVEELMIQHCENCPLGRL